MAFSYTYKEIFSRAAFSRTWLASSRRDKSLRYSVILGFFLAYCLGALVAGDFPPEKELLTPFIFVAKFELLPAVALFPIVFYVSAWVADEFPLRSRQVIVAAGMIGLFAYAFATVVNNPESYVSRIGFFVYPIAIATIALAQIRSIRSAVRESEQ